MFIHRRDAEDAEKTNYEYKILSPQRRKGRKGRKGRKEKIIMCVLAGLAKIT